MRLTAIHLNGFKSFADKTVFPVDAPLTGILGPNGCGKSNIIDAIRWVLGETAAKQLRGQSMSDVVFAGCASRKPARSAYVELHFDNQQQRAGGAFAEFAEIVVRREVDGEGQSRYLINQKRCRRRDIIELLQGTGIGARSYAVIEQGMIGRIIEAKPEELRAFVEEAAGIALYQSRRKESERKMAQVQEHLSRHQDRLYDLGRQRDRLQAQAEVAHQFQQLQKQLGDEQYFLNSWRLHQGMQKLRAAEQSYLHQQHQLDEQQQALNRVLEQAAPLMAQQQRQKQLLDAAKQSVQQCRQAALRAEQQQQKQQQSIHLEERQYVMQQQRLAQIVQRQQDDEQLIAGLHDELAQLDDSSAQVQESLTQAQMDYDQKQEHHQSVVYQKERILRQQQDEQRRRDEARTRYGKAQQRLSELKRQMSEATQSEGDVEAIALRLEEAQMKAEEAQLLLEQDEEQVQQTASDDQELQQRYQQSATALQAIQIAYEQKQSRAETLREWLVQDTSGEAVQGEPLLAQLSVAEEWQVAVERFLGVAIHARYTEQYQLSEAITATGSVIGRGAVPDAWREIIHTPAALGDWLHDVVPLALHDDAVIAEQLSPSQRYLTLDGTLISAQAVLRDDSGAGHLEKISALHHLEAELSDLMTEMAQAEQRHEDLARSLERCKIKLQQQQAQLKQTQSAQQTAQNDYLLLQQQQQHELRLHRQQQTMLQHWQQEKAELEQVVAQCSAILDEPLPLAEDSDLSARVQQAEQAKQHARLHYERIAQQQRQLDNDISAKKATLHTITTQLQRYQHEHDDITQQMATQKAQLAEYQDALLLLNDEVVLLQEELMLAEEAAEVQEASYTALAQSLQEQEKAQLQLHHHIELAQVKVAQFDEERQRLREEVGQWQAFFAQSDRRAIRFDDAMVVNVQEKSAHIQVLQQKIQSLGAVNRSAAEDYAEIDREYQTLTEQCEDLRNSLTMLEAAISDLDNETRSRLQETMSVVNHHFAQLFPRLFRGGVAQLTWTGEDVLQAGIHIAVKPPGKNVKSLSVLSGGEKALTAIALVFALFKLNPAPFCLLDEVDAPLDDGNVGRLSALLRDMSGQTQFIIITHHKSTMQSCDHLIGVTMSEPGISRLVAVKTI